MKTFVEYLNEAMDMEKMMSKAEKMMPKEVKKQDDDFQYAWMRGAIAAMTGKPASYQLDKEFMDFVSDMKNVVVLKNAWKGGYEYVSSGGK